MNTPSRSSAARITALAVGLALLAAFLFGYHRLIQRSVRQHPEVAQEAVKQHCRFMLGKQLEQMPKSEFEAKYRVCDDVRVKSIEASGGVFDPVMVRITIEPLPQLPVQQTVFIFRSIDMGPERLSFLTSLTRLSSGRWEFNSATTYSNTTFRGSF